MTVRVGAFEEVTGADGATAPFYVLRFDRQGASEGPRTQAEFVRTATGGDFTDLYLFSHGWNNTFDIALQRYRDFIGGFRQLRIDRGLEFDRPYRPILAGIVWPSTSYVFPWEDGPTFAASTTFDESVLIREIADDLSDASRAAFYELLDVDEYLTEAEARRLAATLVESYSEGDADVGNDARLSVGAVMAGWRPMSDEADDELFVAEDPDAMGTQTSPQIPATVEVEAAGLFSKYDPRQLLRLFTVRKMKDRAGRIGFSGVGPMLDEIVATMPTLNVHVTGHSYGARVLLSAVCSSTRPIAVSSMLLLEPAVSHLCFADAVPGTGRPGGYRAALERVQMPILSTFSAHDFPLTRVFHLALNRSEDLGEAQIAADDPPSIYAALGGYGPRGVGQGRSEIVTVREPGDPYDLDADAPDIYGVDATRTISGHGAVSVPSTWWAQYCLTAAVSG